MTSTTTDSKGTTMTVSLTKINPLAAIANEGFYNRLPEVRATLAFPPSHPLGKLAGMTVQLRTPELDILLDKGHNDTTAPLIAGYDFPTRGVRPLFGCFGEYDD